MASWGGGLARGWPHLVDEDPPVLVAAVADKVPRSSFEEFQNLPAEGGGHRAGYLRGLDHHFNHVFTQYSVIEY